MRTSILSSSPQFIHALVTAGVALSVGLAIAVTADPVVIVALAVAAGAAVAFAMTRSEAARRSFLVSALTFSFVWSGWRRDTGFIVLEPWMIVLPMCFVVWAGEVVVRRRLTRLDGVGILALFVMLTAWLSFLGAVDVLTWLKRASKITLLFGLYLLLVNWANEKRQLSALIRAGFFGCAVAGATISMQMTRAWLSYGLIDVFGAPGTFANGNEAATFLALFILVGLALYASGVHSEVVNRRALFATLSVIAVGVLLTRSRTGVVAVIAASAMLFIRTARVRRLVLGAVALLVVLGLITPTRIVVDRLLATVGMSGNEEYDAFIQAGGVARIYLLEVYWTVVKANPVFGIGAGNYGFISSLGIALPSPPAGLMISAETLLNLSPHNGFISWWVEAGTVGFGAFLVSLLYSVFALARARRRWLKQQRGDRWWYAVATGALGGLVVFILTNLTADFGVSEVRYWLLLALTTICVRHLRKVGGAAG